MHGEYKVKFNHTVFVILHKNKRLHFRTYKTYQLSSSPSLFSREWAPIVGDKATRVGN
jgi:hypothetical protein